MFVRDGIFVLFVEDAFPTNLSNTVCKVFKTNFTMWGFPFVFATVQCHIHALCMFFLATL